MDLHDNPTYYPLFPVFAFFGFFLVLIPLPWHIRAWNVGTCAYILWASAACLLEFVNSLVWRNSVLNFAPVWCDISSKILLGAGVGIPAAGLCISSRLYTISTVKSAVVTYQDRRRAVIIDSCIAFGIPILVMMLHYVVQSHRFDILEDVGCYPTIYNTPLAYLLVFMWPTVLGSVSFVLSALTLHAFHKRRLEFNQFLSTHSSMSVSRYVRLMMLAIAEMICTVPVSIYSIYSIYISTNDIPLQPWTSWANVHYDLFYVRQVPAIVWTGNSNYYISVELTRWLFPASAFLFFLLFGFGTEARKHYRSTFLRIARVLTYKSTSDVSTHMVSQQKTNISVVSLPVHVTFPHVKPNSSSMLSAGHRVDINVQEAVDCSSSSLANDSPRNQQSSLTATCMGDGTDKSAVPAPSFPRFSDGDTDYHTVPGYRRPFTLPSICPAPPLALQGSWSMDSVHITV